MGRRGGKSEVDKCLELNSCSVWAVVVIPLLQRQLSTGREGCFLVAIRLLVTGVASWPQAASWAGDAAVCSSGLGTVGPYL